MFENYFVTCNVAVALKEAGFDEPCMAAWEHYNHKGGVFDTLVINYNNQPVNPEIYNATIQQTLRERPGLFQEQYHNSILQPWLYAAPLYQQALEWLEGKGLYLHPYRVPRLRDKPKYYGVNIFDEEGKQLWPAIPLGESYHEKEMVYYFTDNISAYYHAIFAALEILKERN